MLDEFGRLEARGEGLMRLWQTFAAAAPQIVVLSVRAELVAEIEEQLQRKFDLRISAAAPNASTQLRRACEDFGEALIRIKQSRLPPCLTPAELPC